MSFDTIYAELACASCNQRSRAQLQTRLAIEPEGRALEVGSTIELPGSAREIEESGYRVIKAPAKGSPLVFLETWSCPRCAHPFNWARVELDPSGKIARIEATKLDRPTLEAANFITEEALHVADHLAGRNLGPASKVDLVRVLREKLPK